MMHEETTHYVNGTPSRSCILLTYLPFLETVSHCGFLRCDMCQTALMRGNVPTLRSFHMNSELAKSRESNTISVATWMRSYHVAPLWRPNWCNESDVVRFFYQEEVDASLSETKELIENYNKAVSLTRSLTCYWAFLHGIAHYHCHPTYIAMQNIMRLLFTRSP